MAAPTLHYSCHPDPEACGLFAGLGVADVQRVQWHYPSAQSRCGHFWVARGADNVIWVADQHDRMAMALMNRVVRYLHPGIGQRIARLIHAYLNRDMIPIPPGARVINFGANVGEVAIGLVAMGAWVIAIEPDPNVLPALKANGRGRPIRVVPAAAWKEDGPITLYVASKKADSSVIDVCGEPTTVAGRRIDTLLSEFGADHQDVHLLLGDAEGAEPEVLEGATETLKRTRYVSLRVSPERHGKSSVDLCEPLLRAAGFDILYNANETLIGRNQAL